MNRTSKNFYRGYSMFSVGLVMMGFIAVIAIRKWLFLPGELPPIVLLFGFLIAGSGFGWMCLSIPLVLDENEEEIDGHVYKLGTPILDTDGQFWEVICPDKQHPMIAFSYNGQLFWHNDSRTIINGVTHYRAISTLEMASLGNVFA